MAFAHINYFSQTGRAYDTEIPVFDGDCSQDRTDIATVAASFPATAVATVATATKFIQIVTDGKLKVYSGPAAADNATKQARAFVMAAGTYALSAKAGDVIHIWLA